MDRRKQNLRIYDPAATRAEQTAANARELAGLKGMQQWLKK